LRGSEEASVEVEGREEEVFGSRRKELWLTGTVNISSKRTRSVLNSISSFRLIRERPEAGFEEVEVQRLGFDSDEEQGTGAGVDGGQSGVFEWLKSHFFVLVELQSRIGRKNEISDDNRHVLKTSVSDSCQ